MPIDRVRGSELLKSFDFRRLFIEEIGWDKHSGRITHAIDGHGYDFQVVTEKRGVVFLVCDSIPDSSVRLKLDKAIAKTHFQHLIVFADRGAGKQLWQWVRYESGKPLSVRSQGFNTSQSGELLLQKLDHLVVSLEEEDQIAHGHVAGRLQAGFDVERVTRRFYDRFKTEHDKFLQFIDGIPDDLAPWYASVMINRLMFIYFLQAKGFLNSDNDYLRNKLAASRDRKQDAYYREFLCPLFFQGFARRPEERSAAINKLLGAIPYLNGGLFQQHQIEDLRGKKIDIPDAAFQRLLDFFKDYDWHLDDRPNRADNEINPDVLGYIFEKYINQKQMGAYYTKEDITEYISQNTIIPFLLYAAREDCAVAFDENGSAWGLLRDDPNRYIHNPVLHGSQLPLPPDISAGIADVKQRSGWNRPASQEFALPTELWREVVERRCRCQELREKLSSGQVHEVNDLLSLNLNLRQFAQDAIRYCEGPELLRALYKAISAVSVLDPTCGSGAFLFAALSILKPLYEACLERMREFVEDLDASSSKNSQKFKDFRQILEESRRHPRPDYFVLKKIIVDNLYGVDIMEEAVEICKLRLFLKLVAQLEPGQAPEPLPDVDFNIRAGNTLVGYATYQDVQNATRCKFDFDNAMERLEDKAKILDAAVARFRQQQTFLNGAVTIEDKQELRRRFTELEAELDDFLAGEYGVKKSGLKAWKQSHKPFHWFCDFHRIMTNGGFDVIIGNPPYVEYKQVRAEYALADEYAQYLGNLYAACSYRATRILSPKGCFGFIVPVSLPSTDRMTMLRTRLLDRHAVYHVGFSTRPSKLFEGAEQRLTVFLRLPSDRARLFSGGYKKWGADERANLFPQIRFVETTPIEWRQNLWPKVSGSLARSVMDKLLAPVGSVGTLAVGPGQPLYYKNTGLRYFNSVTLRAPKCWINGRAASSSRETTIEIKKAWHNPIHALLLSSTFFFLYQAFSNCRDLNPSDILSFKLPSTLASDQVLTRLSHKIEADYTKKAKILTMNNRLTGEVKLESVSPARSKPIIDEIDAVLARHYGLTDEELDFIINYDIKYRLGADTADEE